MLIFGMVLLQAKEDFSVHVKLTDKNITSLSQLILAESKHYYDTGYYLPIKVSYVNNTDTIQHLLIGWYCSSIKSWEVKGNLQFIEEKIPCKKTTYGRSIILQPKERLKRTLKLLFPQNYLNKSVRFKIGFKKIIWNRVNENQSSMDAGFKHIITYWSKWVVINANAQRIYKK